MFRRVLLYNSLDEPTFYTKESTFERIDTYSALIEKLKKNESYYRISYRGVKDDVSMEVDFDYCCKAVGACYDLHYAVEEIGLHSNSWKMPNSLQTIVAAGRHRGISFYCTSQRAAKINPLIRALATSIVTFKQTEPQDIEWLSEVIGPELAYKVPDLGLHQKLEWSDDAHSQRTDNDIAIDNPVDTP
jgi:hypothetical protein